MLHAHFSSGTNSTNKFWGAKYLPEAKAHSLTVHYQDQEEQKKRERKHPH